ncbi:FMN-dependent NADH-azoreductase [Rhodobacteraceae bacterium RKSG542]|uniref:FMN-dependent NADH-azoreductase n=1 Tax=Pseudovibrio flavus TaxID=2529854 RepID=UPI0012BCF9D5|nr:NAD(P)H-dependent oxidoreductase [Pseudovibrio flavus]MTI19118.1 FMN-dependent NADH-azoreductase [Pseudovibrio flavus]
MTTTLKILSVGSSALAGNSVTRQLSEDLIAKLEAAHGPVELTKRDLDANKVEFIDPSWVGAAYTDPSERTPEQAATLALSDELIAELKAADVIIIGAPMYNFSVPASLKAWVDLVTRRGETFAYSENGPVGLVGEGKKAYIVAAHGGVPVGSPVDFNTPFLKHILGFIGVNDVEVIAAVGVAMDREKAIAEASEQIDMIGKVAA